MNRGGKHRPDKCGFRCYWTAAQKAAFRTVAEVAGMTLTGLVTEVLVREGQRQGIIDLRGNVVEMFQDVYRRHLAECRKQTEEWKRKGNIG